MTDSSNSPATSPVSSPFDPSKVRYRYFRTLDKVRFNWGTSASAMHEHVLTLATYLSGQTMFVGYSLNRVAKHDHVIKGLDMDTFSPEYGRTRALGRLNSTRRISITIDPSKTMLDNIISGLLKIPTETDDDRTGMFDRITVPSALKQVIRKNVKEFKAAQTVTFTNNNVTGPVCTGGSTPVACDSF